MSSRSRFSRGFRLGSLMALLVVASGCTTGGPILTGSNPLASPTPTPAATATPAPTATPAATPTPSPVATPGPGQTSTIVLEGSLSLLGGYVAVFDPFTLSQAGSLDFSADWTSSGNDIDIAVATGSCTSSQLSAGACTFAGLEESPTMKPEQMTLALSAGTYTPLIGNFTTATEAITYRIVFTPNASASQSEIRAFIAAAGARPPVLARMNGKLGDRRP